MSKLALLKKTVDLNFEFRPVNSSQNIYRVIPYEIMDLPKRRLNEKSQSGQPLFTLISTFN